MLKIEIYAPETALSDIQEALLRADAGHLGNYRGCLSWSRVTGSWIPEEGAHPAVGEIIAGERVMEPEIKIETVIPDDSLTDVMKEIKRVHPYEEPLINVLQLIEVDSEEKLL